MSVSASQATKLNNMCPNAKANKLGTRIKLATDYGTHFRKTVTLTAAAAATAVDILTATEVNGGQVFIEGMIINVSGATAWTDATATIVKIESSAGTAAITVAKAGLTGNANIFLQTASNVTLATTVSQGAGIAAAKGIRVKGDANFGAGSDLKVTVWGTVIGDNV